MLCIKSSRRSNLQISYTVPSDGPKRGACASMDVNCDSQWNVTHTATHCHTEIRDTAVSHTIFNKSMGQNDRRSNYCLVCYALIVAGCRLFPTSVLYKIKNDQN